MDIQQFGQEAQVLVEYLRLRTWGSQVTSQKSITMHPPEGTTKEGVAQCLAAIGAEDAPDCLQEITIEKGRKDSYYYLGAYMTVQYAALDVLLQEKDILRTIAVVTRNDSQLYPRPTSFEKLRRPPFYFSKDELLGAAARMEKEADYLDIGVVEASNGAKGFFSSKHLSRPYAHSLIEKFEVEEPNNP